MIAPAPAASANTPKLTAIPADFAAVMGYQPTTATLANGESIVVNPRGGCSVPMGHVADDLQTACQAHDLGYDMLRYARGKGIDVGADARRRVDARFAKDMAIQCAARPADDRVGCEATATFFTSAVRFNSWRQLDGPPVAGSGIARTVGLGLVTLLLGGLGALALRRPVKALRRPVKALRRPVKALRRPVKALRRPVKALAPAGQGVAAAGQSARIAPPSTGTARPVR
jgi:hypothetical protein